MSLPVILCLVIVAAAGVSLACGVVVAWYVSERRRSTRARRKAWRSKA